jgi:hypothetical protein
LPPRSFVRISLLPLAISNRVLKGRVTGSDIYSTMKIGSQLAGQCKCSIILECLTLLGHAIAHLVGCRVHVDEVRIEFGECRDHYATRNVV